MGIFNSKKEDIQEVSKAWYEEIQEKYVDNTKKVFNFGCSNLKGDIIILTNDNKIVYGNKNGKDYFIDEIDISDIMKVDINAMMKNKTRHQWYNLLVLSFEETSKLEYLELKIITLDKIYRFKIDNANNTDKIQKRLDSVEILATYLERKIAKNEF